MRWKQKTSTASASPTSERPRSFGTARRAAPLQTQSCGNARRTAPIIADLCSDLSVCDRIELVTGLHPDAYFSASKIKWLLDNVPGARKLAEEGQLLFGTVDCWLIWNLTGRKVHATDITNASRTMLYDIHKGCWDKSLLELFDIPERMMPEVRPSASFFGETDYPNIPAGIPICGVAGDQQAALFGQCCFEAGQAKNTYGTGCFLLLHTGDTPVTSRNGLVTTIAASAPSMTHTEYALEGSVFMAGALIQWLIDELGIAQTPAETQQLAESIPDTGGVYIVPAFTGLGAPHWEPTHAAPSMGSRAEPDVRTSHAQHSRHSHTRYTTSPSPCRQMQASKSGNSTLMAALRQTISSCSSRATSCRRRFTGP